LRDRVVERSVTLPAKLDSIHLIGTADPRFAGGDVLGFESVPAFTSGVWNPTKVNGTTATV
jgi:hypothetical protein